MGSRSETNELRIQIVSLEKEVNILKSENIDIKNILIGIEKMLSKTLYSKFKAYIKALLKIK